jgi:hypothetical protein
MAKKLTPSAVAAHDFNRALRVWRKVLPPADILKLLVRERAGALQAGLRSFGLAVVGTLWLAANRSELSLKVSLVDFVVPVAYVIFAVSVLYFVTCLQFISYFMLNNFVQIASNKLFKFDSGWALTTLQDGGSAWSAAWVRQFRFLSSSGAHRRWGSAVVWLVNLPAVMVLVTGYWIVAIVGVAVLRSEGVFSIAGAFTIIGWLFMAFPVLLVILLCTRFTFTKNVGFIRWNFLAPMYRRQGGRPPRVNHWIPQPQQTHK